jgi:hypothetical protein
MDPVPYEIREEDIDEVISAYDSTGGGTFTDEERGEARQHVMRNLLELNEMIASAPEERRLQARMDAEDEPRALKAGTPPGADSPRRDMALAAIEDLLIRDGFIEVSEDESRVFPAGGERERVAEE